jgi:hypothetical protein
MATFEPSLPAPLAFCLDIPQGGWAVLWLQANYPDVFNGAWAVSPDSVDFHDFLGPDLTKTGQNFYRDAAGNEYGMCRQYGHDTSTLRRLVHGEGCGRSELDTAFHTKAWGERQFDTYDDVFSPALPNGYPVHLFDRGSGVIDPVVAKYWEEHYDITHALEKHWSALGPLLSGKLHVFVGGEDTFHLEGAVFLMRDALQKLGSDAEFGIAARADHWSIFDYNGGLVRYALSEMVKRVGQSTANQLEGR